MEIFSRLIPFSSIGLLFAILFYFHKDLKKILQDKKHKYKLFIYIIITCIVGVSAGWASTEIIKRYNLFSDIYSLTIVIGVTGIAMIIIDNVIKKDKIKDENKITAPQAMIIGSSEILASFPGTFHLAANIITGRLIGLNNKIAAKYSFITAIPFICGVFANALFIIGGFDYFSSNIGVLLISNMVTFIASLLVISLVFKILEKPKTLQWFGYSRIVISLVIAIVALLS